MKSIETLLRPGETLTYVLLTLVDEIGEELLARVARKLVSSG